MGSKSKIQSETENEPPDEIQEMRFPLPSEEDKEMAAKYSEIGYLVISSEFLREISKIPSPIPVVLSYLEYHYNPAFLSNVYFILEVKENQILGKRATKTEYEHFLEKFDPNKKEGLLDSSKGLVLIQEKLQELSITFRDLCSTSSESVCNKISLGDVKIVSESLVVISELVQLQLHHLSHCVSHPLDLKNDCFSPEEIAKSTKEVEQIVLPTLNKIEFIVRFWKEGMKNLHLIPDILKTKTKWTKIKEWTKYYLKKSYNAIKVVANLIYKYRFAILTGLLVAVAVVGFSPSLLHSISNLILAPDENSLSILITQGIFVFFDLICPYLVDATSYLSVIFVIFSHSMVTRFLSRLVSTFVSFATGGIAKKANNVLENLYSKVGPEIQNLYNKTVKDEQDFHPLKALGKLVSIMIALSFQSIIQLFINLIGPRMCKIISGIRVVSRMLSAGEDGIRNAAGETINITWGILTGSNKKGEQLIASQDAKRTAHMRLVTWDDFSIEGKLQKEVRNQKIYMKKELTPEEISNLRTKLYTSYKERAQKLRPEGTVEDILGKEISESSIGASVLADTPLLTKDFTRLYYGKKLQDFSQEWRITVKEKQQEILFALQKPEVLTAVAGFIGICSFGFLLCTTGSWVRSAFSTPASTAEQSKIMIELANQNILISGHKATLEGFLLTGGGINEREKHKYHTKTFKTNLKLSKEKFKSVTLQLNELVSKMVQ
jgi:hypothetical protein